MNTPQKNTYWPLILVLLFVLGGSFFLVSLGQNTALCTPEFWQNIDAKLLMQYFMGLFFVVFSFFKLLNVPAFARAYQKYDIPTQIVPAWGYVYPFVELALGVMYLHGIYLQQVNIAVIVVLGVSIIGVIQSVRNKQKIQCACLGTGFNLPMSTVTIIEDAVMILMAVGMMV